MMSTSAVGQADAGVDADELDVGELVAQLVHVGGRLRRHEHDEAGDLLAAGERADRLDDDLLGAHPVGPEAQGVDADRQARAATRRAAAEGVGERRAGRRLGRARPTARYHG